MKATIIGGFGFIGRKLLPRLDQEGFDLTVIEKTLKIDDERINKLDLHVLSYEEDNDETLLESDVVIDLSYASNPMTSYKSPTSDILNNLPRAVKLFELLQKSKKLKKLIILSSGGTVYGNQERFPITETSETNPISPYGITKLAIEKYANMFTAIGDLPVVIMRPSNAYGPGQIPFRGQGFISTSIGSILKGEKIILFGKGETVRDYIFVDDLVDGIYHVIQKGKIAETYNIGSGIGFSNIEIVEMLKEIMDADIRIDFQEERSFDVRKNVLLGAKLNRDTGWGPITQLIDGLKITIDWVDNYFHEN